MHYIVLDLEMHPMDDPAGLTVKGLSLETIQIGAVALNDNYEEVSEFETCVCPQYSETMHQRYIDLTGLTDAKVRTAPGFNIALKNFFTWCAGLDTELQILAWSNSDKQQLVREVKLKGYELTEAEKKLLETMKDFQKEFAKLIESRGVLALDKALDYAGLTFDGHQHDGLVDARNTAKLVSMARLEPQALKESAFAKYKGAEMSCKLGDMFDFSSLLSGTGE